MILENPHQSSTISAGIPTTKENLSSQGKLWWLLFIIVNAKAKSGYKRENPRQSSTISEGISTTKANLSSRGKLDWWLLFMKVKAKAKSGYKRRGGLSARQASLSQIWPKKGGGT